LSSGPVTEEQILIDEANDANAANASLTLNELTVKSFLRSISYQDVYILIARDYFNNLIASGLLLTLAEESISGDRVLVNVKALRPEISAQMVADGREVPVLPEVGEVVTYDSNGVEIVVPFDEVIS
jgi:hypothetical protein